MTPLLLEGQNVQIITSALLNGTYTIVPDEQTITVLSSKNVLNPLVLGILSCMLWKVTTMLPVGPPQNLQSKYQHASELFWSFRQQIHKFVQFSAARLCLRLPEKCLYLPQTYDQIC